MTSEHQQEKPPRRAWCRRVGRDDSLPRARVILDDGDLTRAQTVAHPSADPMNAFHLEQRAIERREQRLYMVAVLFGMWPVFALLTLLIGFAWGFAMFRSP